MSSQALRLPALVTVETVEALAGDFKALELGDKPAVQVDASQVENITTPGLQLLVALEKAVTLSGGTLLISGEREPVRAAFRDAGLEGLLARAS